MRAEILMIGTELLIGQINDTNATHIAQVLAENGINLYQKTTVGDNRERIMAALDGALTRSGVVLCSGGLGPTEDDITRECIAELLGRPMEFRQELWDTVLERFMHVRIHITENNKKQATLPAGAIAIDNPRGTAPGLIVEDPRGIIICMPGVPHELKAMLRDDVMPYLRRHFDMSGVLHYRVLKVCGMGESRVDALIQDLIAQHDNPKIGLLASPDAVRIRISARAANVDAAEALIAPVAEAIEERLPGGIMGRDRDTLEGVVDQLLVDRGWRLYLHEITTGGMIAQRLTAAGARAFAGGTVGTATEIADVENVEEFAFDRASGSLLDSGSDCGLAIVPDPQERRSIAALVTPESRITWDVGDFAQGDRNQLRATVYALEQLRRTLLGVPVESK